MSDHFSKIRSTNLVSAENGLLLNTLKYFRIYKDRKAWCDETGIGFLIGSVKSFNPDQHIASDWEMDEKELRRKVAQLLYIIASSTTANMNERIRAVELMGKSLGFFDKSEIESAQILPWCD